MCWFLWGASVWAILQALVDSPQPWEWATIGRYTAYMGLAYVAGFVIILVPSGIGVREFLLNLFLVPEVSRILHTGDDEARAVAVLAVILLRVVWTAAEVLANAMLYWLPGPGVRNIEAFAAERQSEESS